MGNRAENLITRSPRNLIIRKLQQKVASVVDKRVGIHKQNICAFPVDRYNKTENICHFESLCQQISNEILILMLQQNTQEVRNFFRSNYES